MFGGWYPRGGAAAIPRALEKVLAEAGVAVEYGQTVTSVEMDGGRAVAVHTAQGTSLTCSAVVSNAAAPALPDLVGVDTLPAHYLERLQGPTVAASSVTVYLGLDRDVFGEHGLPHEIFLCGIDPDAEHAAGLTGDWARSLLVVADYTRLDPGCGPPGGGVVTLTAPAAYDYAGQWGTEPGAALSASEVKEQVADTLLDVADVAVPGLAAACVYREVSTPRTNQRYTLNPGGSWAGYESTPQVVGFSALGTTTPIPNLFLAGAWTGSFGQTAALRSGVRAGQTAQRYLAETGLTRA
jgi:phytoene dehydrogenase-like protein